MDARHETAGPRRVDLGPYRTADVRSPVDAAEDGAPVDADLLAPFVGFWLVSVVRVVGAVVRHETFFAEASLALIVVVSLPWLLHDSLRGHGRRVVKRWRQRTAGRRRTRA